MTDVQRKLLELLLEFDAICKKHNITYYFIGGTALGAVRHNGFLPWDDDADVVMTRDNWEKFESIIDEELPDSRIYINNRRISDYPSAFNKYVDTSSTSILYSFAYEKVPKGMLLDVFVLTPFPNEEKERKKYLRWLRNYGMLLNPHLSLRNEKDHILNYAWLRVLCKIFKRDKLKKYYFNKLFQYDESECDSYCYVYPRIPLIYPKTIFREPIYYPFEGHLFPIPTNVEQYFRMFFGNDWMIIPDSEHAVVHNMISLPEKSYKIVERAYFTKKEKRIWNKVGKRNKMYVIHCQPYRLKVNKLFQICQGSLYEEKFEKKYSPLVSNLRSLYQNQQYSAVLSELAPYNKCQLNGDCIRAGALIKLPENLLQINAYSLNAVGRYYDAEKLLRVVGNDEEVWTTHLKKIIQIKLDAYALIEENTYADISPLLNELKTLSAIDADLFRLYWRYYVAREDYDLAENAVDRGLEYFPNDGELLKYKGDLLIRSGNVTDAESMYQRARENTRNGLILLAIETYFKGKNINE